MASPHVAGSFALIAARATRSGRPAEAQSALMTTAFTDITDTDGSDGRLVRHGLRPRRPDQGRRRRAGARRDRGRLPAPPTRPWVATSRSSTPPAWPSSQCLRDVHLDPYGDRPPRPVPAPGPAEGVPGHRRHRRSPSSRRPSPSPTARRQEITVTADVTGSPTEDYQFGTVALTPAAGSEAPAAHLPVAALPVDRRLPGRDRRSTPVVTPAPRSPSRSRRSRSPTSTSEAQRPGPGRGRRSCPSSRTPPTTDAFDGNGTEVVDVDCARRARRGSSPTWRNADRTRLRHVRRARARSPRRTSSRAAPRAAPRRASTSPLGEGDAGHVVDPGPELGCQHRRWHRHRRPRARGGQPATRATSGPRGRRPSPRATPFTIRTFWDETADATPVRPGTAR